MTDTPQEIMARGIMEAKGGCIVKDWKTEARDNPHVELAVKQSQAAISALKEAGMVIVPIEPTDAMFFAGVKVAAFRQFAGPIYSAMIGAAIQGTSNED